MLAKVSCRRGPRTGAAGHKRVLVDGRFGACHQIKSTRLFRRVIALDLEHVRTEISLHVLAYNLKRLIGLLGIEKTLKAMRLAGA